MSQIELDWTASNMNMRHAHLNVRRGWNKQNSKINKFCLIEVKALFKIC